MDINILLAGYYSPILALSNRLLHQFMELRTLNIYPLLHFNWLPYKSIDIRRLHLSTFIYYIFI